jgi:hypothetical protein
VYNSVCTCSIASCVFRVLSGVTRVVSALSPISHVHIRESTGRLKNGMKGDERMERTEAYENRNKGNSDITLYGTLANQVGGSVGIKGELHSLDHAGMSVLRGLAMSSSSYVCQASIPTG